LARVLSGRIYGASFAIGGNGYQLGGATRPEDLLLEMQLLTAYLTDPGLRPAPFEQIKALFPQIIAQQMATPAGAFGIQSASLLASGDSRQAFPTAADLAGWTNDQLKAEVSAGLASGPIEVVVVGDTTVDAVVAAVGSTLAALPARGPAPTPAPGADVRRFPAGTPEPVRLTHGGPAEQALGYVAWPSADAVADETEARRINLLAAVLELRVLARIREELAIAYSPDARSSASDVYADYGFIFVSAQTTPENQTPFFAEVDAIAASLRDTPITEDELTRARAPQVEALRRVQAGNEYWLAQLSEVTTQPGAATEITTHISDLEAVTPADIQALAQRYLVPNKAWRASVVSAAPAAQ
jgi:zinc protease